MAKKEQTLLEGIFNTASLIEEVLLYGPNGEPLPERSRAEEVIDNVRRNIAYPTGIATNKVKKIANEIGNKVGEKVGNTAVGRHVIANKKAYKAGAKGGLLGLGLTAAGLGGYALRDKIAGLLAGHHGDEA
jgi:hypothetical protein